MALSPLVRRTASVERGVGHRAFAAGVKQQKFLVYRYDPDLGAKPDMEEYTIDLNQCGPKIMDALLKVKNEVDPTLSFRYFCLRGSCGLCAVNVKGRNCLACLHDIEPGPEPIEVQPVPHSDVLKDLQPDLPNFYDQYRPIEPWLKRRDVKGRRDWEHYLKREERAKLECILSSLSSSYIASYWWNPESYLGPAVLMQAYRWIADARDQFEEERVARVNDTMKVYRCHGITNCTNCCPKGLDLVKTIVNFKEQIAGSYEDGWQAATSTEIKRNIGREPAMMHF